MSFKLVDSVFDLDLPATEKLVLLALARHADNDGSNAFPAVSTLMRETGFCDRQVRKCLKALRNRKIIIAVKGGIHGVTVYRIEIDHAPRHTPAQYAVPPARHAGNSIPTLNGAPKNSYPDENDAGIHEAPIGAYYHDSCGSVVHDHQEAGVAP